MATLPRATRSSQSWSFYRFPGMLNTVYQRLGDINIGLVLQGHLPSETYPSGECAGRMDRQVFTLDISETVAYATEIVNQNPDLLPNTTLGFVIKASCASIGLTIASHMSFLPRNEQTTEFCHGFSEDEVTDLPRYCKDSHDVIGVLGPGRSSQTVPVSSLYAAGRVPIVGATEGIDELSNKDYHPYFFRILSPNVYQVQAMLTFISSNQWSYVSILYVSGAYGQDAYDNLNRLAPLFGICIATSHRLLVSTDYDAVVADLLAHGRARAVILFVYNAEYLKLLEAVESHNATGHFAWVSSAGLLFYYGYANRKSALDPGLGMFVFEIYGELMPDYFDYLNRQNVNESRNPWMKEIWEYLYDCSFDKGTCDSNTTVLGSSKYQPRKSTSSFLDATLTFAHAAHDLLADRCPEARGRQARACITGALLRDYMKNVSFEGFLGSIEFDENQDVKGKYIISQLMYNNEQPSDPEVVGTRTLKLKQIGVYNSRTDTIEYTGPASWSHLNVVDRLLPRTESSLNPHEPPESVCSRPCTAGEYKIEKEVPCCWNCRRCRDNERLVFGNTSCEACPAFTWPDPASGFLSCVDIALTYSSVSDTMPIALTSLTALALVAYLLTFIAYVSLRRHRVIKASSKELSALQLVAIVAGYVTVLLFQMKPTDTLCRVVFCLFCLSFVLLYAPLLVKTVRVFRIFRSGRSNSQNLRCVSPGSQLLIAVWLIAVQVCLCAASLALFAPSARRSQPVWSEKLVELSCDLTLPGLASFLVYNMVLVCLCSVLAVKVRKLPDNFNESQLVAMCVSTTLLIWLAFVPTYFTASRQHVRTFLLSTALLLNHSVALVFLFVPKVYAAAFFPQETGKVVSAQRK